MTKVAESFLVFGLPVCFNSREFCFPPQIVVRSFVGAMDPTRFAELQALLREANEAGSLRDAVAGMPLDVREQPAQSIVRPKAKAKPAVRPVVFQGPTLIPEVDGTMADSSKRLASSFDDDDFDFVSEFAGQVGDLPDMIRMSESVALEEANRALQAAERAAQEEREASFISARHDAINYNFVDHNIPLPEAVADSRSWGRTLITLPKLAAKNLSYHGAVVRALMGNDELDQYFNYILRRFPFRNEPPRTQGPDLSNFLRHIRYVPAVANNGGYRRTYAA